MPDSERPEREREVATALERLDASVERIVAAHVALRERVETIEREYAALREAVTDADGTEVSGDVEKRLARAADENRRLRDTLDEARERAVRLRNRLAVVEDEL